MRPLARWRGALGGKARGRTKVWRSGPVTGRPKKEPKRDEKRWALRGINGKQQPDCPSIGQMASGMVCITCWLQTKNRPLEVPMSSAGVPGHIVEGWRDPMAAMC